MMETRSKRRISTVTPEQLLGPLNDVERKYAPDRLFTAGAIKLPLPRPRAAIVGSRHASERGLELAAEIAKVLVKKSAIVVSGLAEGIDTAAHRAAIDAGGLTIAVLGTPLDQVYPKKNSPLQDEIMRDHLAVSQFPVGDPIRRLNFVMRNRTMALISNASVIVEAGETSGSLHQGWEVLRLGRPLFIWTDLVKSSLNWPKRMLRYGALELKDPEQILDLLPSRERILIKIAR
jgi:DNA processing protein